jgi:hypothetical protein
MGHFAVATAALTSSGEVLLYIDCGAASDTIEMLREPGAGALVPLSVQQFEKWTMCQQLGLSALQTCQVA